MRFENAVTIRRPPHEVFEFLADFENVPKWNYAIVETRKASGGPVGVGTTYRQTRSLPSPAEETFEITEFESDRRLAIYGDLGPFKGTLAYDLEDANEGTLLTNAANLEAHGVLKLAAPLASGRVGQAVAANLQKLKEILEK
jgi:carbon monoxide dehydrogenase subunit G